MEWFLLFILKKLLLLSVCLFRYKISGRVMPIMREWMQKVIGIDIEHRSPAQVCHFVAYISPAQVCHCTIIYVCEN